MFDAFDPIAIQRETRVWNAWFGEETRIRWLNHPWCALVSWRAEKWIHHDMRRHLYGRVRSRPELAATEYARFPLWLLLWPCAAVEGYAWDVLGYLYRRGLIHVACPPAVKASWRDLRLGPGADR